MRWSHVPRHVSVGCIARRQAAGLRGGWGACGNAPRRRAPTPGSIRPEGPCPSRSLGRTIRPRRSRCAYEQLGVGPIRRERRARSGGGYRGRADGPAPGDREPGRAEGGGCPGCVHDAFSRSPGLRGGPAPPLAERRGLGQVASEVLQLRALLAGAFSYRRGGPGPGRLQESLGEHFVFSGLRWRWQRGAPFGLDARCL